jgi:hypothetical protein
MSFSAFSLIVVVNDFDFMGSILLPYKTDSILLIDPDAVLPNSASGHLFQLISGRLLQIVEMNSHYNHVQLAKSHTCNAVPPPILPELCQFCGVTVLKTYDHILIICCTASNAIRLSDMPHQLPLGRWPALGLCCRAWVANAARSLLSKSRFRDMLPGFVLDVG